jgi:FAD/FMN-containing dehydrogenase
MRPTGETLARLAAVVGEANVVRDATAMQAYLQEWRGLWHGRSPLIVRPASTAEVSALLAICHETTTAVVPQSGNTGLVGGQIPFGDEIVLSLDRMTRIRDIDPVDNTITVDAGVILKNVQDAALAVDRYFPLSLAAEGSCRIGGNLSTNAGGIGVIAYGNMRDLCLGLEVVLADGRIWDGLHRLRKDNTGYDLKNLFIGAEGTLGIITGAVLKLFPRPAVRSAAFIAVPTPQAALDLLALAQARSGSRVTAVEIMARMGLNFVFKHFPVRDPFERVHPWYLLLELSGSGDLDAVMTELLAAALDRGIVADAAIAQSEAQRAAFWQIREMIVEVQRLEGGSIKHDVSVPVSRIPELIDRGHKALEEFMPGVRPMPFGHLGDGNLHFNVTQPVGMDRQAFLDSWEGMAACLHGIVLHLGGSVSAEHGIGQLKRDLMPEIKTPVELQMMRALKSLYDPKSILNPGKLLPLQGT